MKRSELLFYFIIFIAFLVRVFGIWFDLPYVYTTEEYKVINYALRMAARKSLNPDFFQYPSLYLYFTLLISGIIYLIGKILGSWATSFDFAVSFLKNPSVIYIPMRFLSSVWSTLSAILTYKIAKLVFDKKTAIISTVFITFIPSIIISAHQVRPNMPAMFFGLLSFYFAIKYFDFEKIKYFYFSSIFLGIATSIYYNSVFLLFSLLLIYFIKKKKISFDKTLIISFLLFQILFIFGSPFVIVNFSSFSKDIVGHSNSLGANFIKNFAMLIRYLLYVGHNSPKIFILGLLCYVGMIYAMIFRKEIKIFFLIFTIFIYVLFVSLYRYPGQGYIFIIVPLFLIFGAYLINEVIKKNKLIGIFVFIVALLPSLVETILTNYSYTLQDTRTISLNWIKKNIPSKSIILLDRKPNSPPLIETKEQLKQQLNLADKINHYKKEYLKLNYQIQNENSGYWIYQILHDPKDIDIMTEMVKEAQKVQALIDVSEGISVLKKYGIEYVILNSWDIENAKKNNAKNLLNFYDEVQSKLLLVQELKPKSKLHPGPEIWIYKNEL